MSTVWPASAPTTFEVRPATVWNSWHLHLGSAARSVHDRVVTDVIGPAVRAVGRRPWFFVRYWQAGPHLRLRVGDLDPMQVEQVEQSLRQRLAVAGALADGEDPIDPAGYARSARQLAGAEEQEPVHQLLDCGVYRRTYEPEFDRYGGESFMPRSEQLFWLSSELVLAFLADAPSTRLRVLMALRATMAAAAALRGHVAQADYYAHGLEALRSWAVRYGYTTDQVDRLCAAARDSVTAPAGGAPPAPPAHGPLAGWYAALADLAEAVHEHTHPAPIVFSHVHMLHNRLGLTMVEELQNYARLTGLVPDGVGPAAQREEQR